MNKISLAGLKSGTGMYHVSQASNAPDDHVQILAGKVSAAKGRHDKSVENAVYGHIRAVRALGRTTVDTGQIARALGIPIHEVDRVIVKLNSRGVRLLGK